MPDFRLARGRVLHLVPRHFDLFKQQHFFDRAHLEGLHGIVHTENDHTGVKVDLLEEVANECLLLNESDVGQGIGGLSDRVVQTILESVLDIVGGDQYILEPLIEGVTLLDDGLEISATCHHNTFNIGNIVGNKVLRGQLGNLLHISKTLLLSDSCKTIGRLTTSAVLFGQLYCYLLLDITDISLQGGEESTRTIDDDEAELLVVLQEEVEHRRVEPVLAAVIE